MGALIRAYDWSSSPLGPPDGWPQNLRVMIQQILNTRFPMFIYWGPNLIQFYNDAYRDIISPAWHPKALGASGQDFCAENWHVVGPQIKDVMAGKGSTWDEDRLLPVTLNGRLEEHWWSYSYSPIEVDGAIGGILGLCNDVTAQHLAREALEERTRHFAQLFERAPSFMAVVTGPNHVFTHVNAAYRNLFGDRDFVGNPLGEIMPEIAPPGSMTILDEAYRTGKAYVFERQAVGIRREAGEAVKELFVDSVFQPIVEANGVISGIFIAGVDVTAAVDAEQHLLLMNAELKHRVKNNLSIVGAIAAQTLRNNPTDAAFQTFQDRLTALGRAQDILTATSQPTASVRDVVENALAPYTAAGRISVSGQRIIVGSKQALSLGMALHEMATNAVKYGALSNDLGRIEISWRLERENGDRKFHFLWRESGGPPIARPSRKGFGSGLIEGRLAWDFGGRVEVGYEPTGFVCRLTAPKGGLGWPIAPVPPPQSQVCLWRTASAHSGADQLNVDKGQRPPFPSTPARFQVGRIGPEPSDSINDCCDQVLE